jgi:DNA-binding transcriptional LysR family regulator
VEGEAKAQSLKQQCRRTYYLTYAGTVDERQLQILRELRDLGSVRAVAESLRITPSAVSQQLRLLQRPLPMPLTRREGRVLRLTEAGEELAAAAADVASAMARARDVARGLAAAPAGTVTLSAFNSAALAFFGPLATCFPPGHDVTVHFTDEDVSQEEFPRLTARYDIVIAHRLAHTPGWPATIRVTRLLDEPLDVALPPGHRLAGRGPLTAADVVDGPWITTHEGFPVGATLDTVAAVAGRPATVRHRVNEFTVVADLVRSGAGLGFLPRWTQPTPDGVELRPLADARVSRAVDALARPERAARPATRQVLDRLTAIAEELRSGT